MPLFNSKGSRHECRILMLDNSEQKYEVNNKTFGDELITKVLRSLDIYEKEYFGLRFKDKNGSSHWLDPHKLVKKQVSHGQVSYLFYFGVKFYAADPTKLREEITRYQFFLQVKQDILLGRIPCELQTAAELCAFAVQSELGDFDPALHTEGFISEFHFVPQQSEELETLIVDTYTKLRGLQPCEAERKFLERIKWLDMYGVDIHSVKGQDGMDYLLGMTPTGIVLFKNKNKIGSFIWPKVTKLKYKGNTFILRATQGRNDEEKEYTFLCVTKDYAKSLWKHCAEHHTFFRLERANDVPSSGYNFLFKKTSAFKFSGRTQQEIEQEIDNRPRDQPLISRKPSQRYTRRSNSSLSYQDATPKNKSLMTARGGDGNPPMSPMSTASTISAPWEAVLSEQQSGLYSNGQRNSYPNRPASTNLDRGTSPKFPSRSSGYHSSGEAEQKRKRSQQYYSGYTSTGNNDTESMRKGMSNSSEEYFDGKQIEEEDLTLEPFEHEPPFESCEDSLVGTNYDTTFQEEDIEHIVDGISTLPAGQYGVPNGQDPRRYRPSGSKSDGEGTNKLRRQQQYQQQVAGNQSESEMIAPLDVYHNTSGGAVPNEDRQRRVKHRHQQQQRRHPRHPGYAFDPNQAEVLLELGPNTSANGEPYAPAMVNVSRHQSMNEKENLTPVSHHPPSQHLHHPPPQQLVYTSSPHDPQYGVQYGGGNPPPQHYIQQYLPSHLLKQQGRPPMLSGIPANSMQQPQAVYRAHTQGAPEQALFKPINNMSDTEHSSDTPTSDLVILEEPGYNNYNYSTDQSDVGDKSPDIISNQSESIINNNIKYNYNLNENKDVNSNLRYVDKNRCGQFNNINHPGIFNNHSSTNITTLNNRPQSAFVHVYQPEIERPPFQRSLSFNQNHSAMTLPSNQINNQPEIERPPFQRSLSFNQNHSAAALPSNQPYHQINNQSFNHHDNQQFAIPNLTGDIYDHPKGKLTNSLSNLTTSTAGYSHQLVNNNLPYNNHPINQFNLQPFDANHLYQVATSQQPPLNQEAPWTPLLRHGSLPRRKQRPLNRAGSFNQIQRLSNYPCEEQFGCQ